MSVTGGVLVFTLGATIFGCRAPTEVVITIDTELGIPCDVDALDLRVAGTAGVEETRTIDLTTAELPLYVAVVSESDVSTITVDIEASFKGTTVLTSSGSARLRSDESTELRFQLDERCLTTDGCPGLEIPAFSKPPSALTRANCGRRAYRVSESKRIPLVDACSALPGAMAAGMFYAQVLGPSTTPMERDVHEVPKDIPFPFRFYDRTVDKLWIGTNGYVAFGGDTAPGETAIQQQNMLSSEDFTSPGILAFGDDLTTRETTGVCLAVQGSPPTRTLWITWKEACFSPAICDGTAAKGLLTFSVGLEETTHKVIVGYHEMIASGPLALRAQGQIAVIGLTAGLPQADKPCLSDPGCGRDGVCSTTGETCGFTQWAFRKANPDFATNMPPRLIFEPGKRSE